MNRKFLMAVAGVLAFSASKSQAQNIVFVTDDTAYSHPEVLVHIPSANEDNVIMQNTSFTDNDTNTVNVNNDKKDESISYYVQKLNLSPEQMEKAQEINERTHAEQKRILQSVEDLRQQAHELESKSLSDFEAILTPEQKDLLSQLRNEHDNTKAPNYGQPQKVIESAPDEKIETKEENKPETVKEQQADTTSAPQEENKPEIKPETMPEPQQEIALEPEQVITPVSQPEPAPEPEQEIVTVPQAEAATDTVPEPVYEINAEAQPEPAPDATSEPQPDTLQ